MKNSFLYKVIIGTLAVILAVVIISFSTRTVLSATSTLNFPSTDVGLSSDLTMTVAGASVGDAVALGTPTAAIVATGCFTAWISAANTVTVGSITVSNAYILALKIE